MGTDIHIYVELRGEDGDWIQVGVCEKGYRNYRLWGKWDEIGHQGLPDDLGYGVRFVKSENEYYFGWHWLPMEEFYALKKSEEFLPKIYKKSMYPDLRVIWCYDN